MDLLTLELNHGIMTINMSHKLKEYLDSEGITYHLHGYDRLVIILDDMDSIIKVTDVIVGLCRENGIDYDSILDI